MFADIADVTTADDLLAEYQALEEGDSGFGIEMVTLDQYEAHPSFNGSQNILCLRKFLLLAWMKTIPHDKMKFSGYVYTSTRVHFFLWK